MLETYPLTGFHFEVAFDLPGMKHNDSRFQEVSGLNVSVQTEEFAEGGENRFVHKLPQRLKFSELELKRGLFKDSKLIEWVRDAMEQFQFKPTNITVTLLNDLHVPVAAWQVVGAYPIHWSVSGFNAQQNSLVVESIKLEYDYFKTVSV